jgi:hypothetical protein
MNPMYVSPYMTVLCDKTGRLRGVQDHTGNRDTVWLEDSMLERYSGTPRYVDFRTAANGGKGSASNDGLSPDTPLLTMAAALTAVQDYDSIGFVGKCTESGLSSSKTGVRIYGMGRNSGAQCIWHPSSSATAITVNGKGWQFDNFKAEPAAGKTLISASQTASVNGSDLVIAFVEQNGGGMLLDAANIDNVTLINIFGHDADTAVIRCNDITVSPALRWRIIGGWFLNNLNHVIAKLTDSVVVGGFYQAQGYSQTATSKLDLSGASAGRNIVTGIIATGTYSIAGGYKAGTGDTWFDINTSSGKTSSVPA